MGTRDTSANVTSQKEKNSLFSYKRRKKAMRQTNYIAMQIKLNKEFKKVLTSSIKAFR